MLFTIDHTTEYRFTRPVFFEPHHLRFCPRNDGSQRVVRFDLQIDPTPAGCTQSLDIDGNLVTVAWFTELHDRLVLRAIRKSRRFARTRTTTSSRHKTAACR